MQRNGTYDTKFETSGPMLTSQLTAHKDQASHHRMRYDAWLHYLGAAQYMSA